MSRPASEVFLEWSSVCGIDAALVQRYLREHATTAWGRDGICDMWSPPKWWQAAKLSNSTFCTLGSEYVSGMQGETSWRVTSPRCVNDWTPLLLLLTRFVDLRLGLTCDLRLDTHCSLLTATAYYLRFSTHCSLLTILHSLLTGAGSSTRSILRSSRGCDLKSGRESQC